MNIRSVSNPSPVMGKEKIESSKAIKSDETSDREANGQQPFADEEAHRALTEAELEQVVEKIKAHEGIQKNALLVKVISENNQTIVCIETPEGQVVKRFVERDLYFFLTQNLGDDFHLVNKSA
jgi:dephospho-CoA kinase